MSSAQITVQLVVGAGRIAPADGARNCPLDAGAGSLLATVRGVLLCLSAIVPMHANAPVVETCMGTYSGISECGSASLTSVAKS